MSKSERAANRMMGSYWESPFASLNRNKSLVLELSKRDVLGRYRGASFGLAWSVISPFLTLCVYSFAFGEILKSRWPPNAGAGHPFAIILFVGLIVHGFFSECATRATTLIVGNPSFVKRVVFPLDILPWSMLFSVLFHALVSCCVLALLMLTVEHSVPMTFLLFPIVLVPLMLGTLGVSWFLASVGVYFRDISQVMPVISTALLFVSSAMVPVSTLSPSLQEIFYLNPLTFFIDQARQVALMGMTPDWAGLGIATAIGLLVAMLGHAWFVATQRGFADVL